MGGILNAGLKEYEGHPLVLECRGIGLAAAVEFYDKSVCAQVLAGVKEKGYLPGQLGCTLYCKPPYVITEEQVRGFLKAFGETLAEVGRR